MKLMIVDDEVIIRTGLSTVIDWAANGFELLAPAASAEEALLRIPLERPDIVLTDIRMTGKSGLEMAHEVKRAYPDTEIVVLSGYDEFTYAQQAMRDGVSDYLLKTSRPDEIAAAAVRASERLRHRRREREQGMEERQALRSKRLAQLLLAERPPQPSAVEEALQRYPVLQAGPDNAGFNAALVAVFGKEDGQQDPLLYEAFGSMLRQLLGAETVMAGGLLAVVAGCGPAGGASFAERMRGALRKAGEALECGWFAAYGSPETDAGRLSSCYQTAKAAFEYRWLFEDTGIVGFEEVRRRRGVRAVCTEEEERVLTSILISCSRPDLNAWTGKTLAGLRKDPDATPGSVRSYLHSLVISGHRWLVRAAEAVGYSGTLPDLERLKDQDLADKPAEALLGYFEALMDKYAEIVSGSHQSVKRAMAYIREHLDESLSLQQVARHVHMNPNYFSELFKRESGLNYIEFVTEERLKRAMGLLAETPAKVSEIAGRIGYADLKHFNKLFKKYTGLTPSEYRGKRRK
ncbi:helix-turn-helix domain-containing protein [Paenibacillus thailandensis]|uniref:Helix-turn-helix domain-containing protein n=1 Tax=Paenibacillus thailandensis TaxID=393250 RepID=A0ABW5QUX4_9BACL